MTKCISFGKIEKKYIYMIFIYIIMDICLFIIIILYGLKNISDKKLYELYENNNIINKIFFYINQSFLYVFEFIRNRHNSLSNVNTSKTNNSFKIKILFIGLTSLLELIYLFVEIILNFEIFRNIDLDTSYMNLLFLIFSSYCFMKYNFYKHHYFAAIILLIMGIIKNLGYALLSEISSLLQIFPLMMKSFLVSILYGLYKILMDKYYFSPYKLSYIIGLINMAILLIISIVFTYIPCNENMESFCLIENEEQNYFINLKSYFNYENLRLIIFSFINSIIYSLQNLLIKMIIQDFTLCHTFIPIRLFNFIIDVNMACKYGEKLEHKKILLLFLLIILVSYAIELILSLVFLEFIELNFCGLSKNIKRNIRKRAKIDPIDIINSEENLIMINDQYYIDEEDKNESDDESENENDILEMTKTIN